MDDHHVQCSDVKLSNAPYSVISFGRPHRKLQAIKTLKVLLFDKINKILVLRVYLNIVIVGLSQ